MEAALTSNRIGNLLAARSTRFICLRDPASNFLFSPSRDSPFYFKPAQTHGKGCCVATSPPFAIRSLVRVPLPPMKSFGLCFGWRVASTTRNCFRQRDPKRCLSVLLLGALAFITKPVQRIQTPENVLLSPGAEIYRHPRRDIVRE